MFSRISLAIFATAAVFAGAAAAKPLVVPFDFSRAEIALDVTVKGTPLYVLLDTGVDPSAIDLARADALHLKVDRGSGGEASGIGNAKHVEMYAATIDGLAVGGRSFPPIDAAASDFSALSTHYGRKLDGMLGFSFLKDKIVLIDYPAHTLALLDRVGDAAPLTKSCRSRWSTPLQFLKDENWPLLSQFRIGGATFAATLDTGSSGSVTLYPGVLDLPGVRAALARKGEASSTGFRGSSALVEYAVNAPMGFGPFRLPAGGNATLRDVKTPGVLANIGNKLFAALKLKMLLDYRGKTMTFFGSCS